jgi:hypothetical protein
LGFIGISRAVTVAVLVGILILDRNAGFHDNGQDSAGKQHGQKPNVRVFD